MVTWNRSDTFSDGTAEGGGGLSHLGHQLVDRLVELGMILDLAHASRRAYAQILERAQQHAGALFPRNLS